MRLRLEVPAQVPWSEAGPWLCKQPYSPRLLVTWTEAQTALSSTSMGSKPRHVAHLFQSIEFLQFSVTSRGVCVMLSVDDAMPPDFPAVFPRPFFGHFSPPPSRGIAPLDSIRGIERHGELL